MVMKSNNETILSRLDFFLFEANSKCKFYLFEV